MTSGERAESDRNRRLADPALPGDEHEAFGEERRNRIRGRHRASVARGSGVLTFTRHSEQFSSRLFQEKHRACGGFRTSPANRAPYVPPHASEPPVTATSKVIAFANQKGGVAKTTTTLNLAVAFVEEGHRVLCCDMDPQSNLTMSQGIDPDSLENSMYDVLVHQLSIREVIRKREIDVACASIDLAGAENAVSTRI